MLRRSLDGRVTEAQFVAAGIASDTRPEQLDIAAWGRAGRGGHRVTEAVTLTAPAKLTLSLRVTGVRADGLHLIDAEMVTLDLADTLVLVRTMRVERHIRCQNGWVGGDGAVRRGRSPRGWWRGRPGDPGAGAGGRTADGRGRQADPQRGRAGRRVSRCRGDPAVGRSHRRRGRGPSRGRRPVLRGRGPGPGHRDRRGARAAAVRGADLHPAHAAGALRHRGGLPGVGRPGRADGRQRQRPRAGGPGRWPRNWRDGATNCAKLPVPFRCSRGVARPGSSRGPSPGWVGVWCTPDPERPGATCLLGAASGCASASSCASSCACACGAS